MLELLPRERVAAEINAGSEADGNLGRRSIGEDPAHLLSRALISKDDENMEGKGVGSWIDVHVHKYYSRILQSLQLLH
jgi:hypothetical protein